MLGGLLSLLFGLSLLPFAGDLPRLIVALTALAIGNGALAPSLNSLISRRGAAGEQGEVMGVAQSAGSLSRVLGPIIAGSLFGALGRGSPYFLGAVLVGGALLLAWRVPRPLAAAASPMAPSPGTPRPQPPLGPAQ